jgi:hypothetical protein
MSTQTVVAEEIERRSNELMRARGVKKAEAILLLLSEDVDLYRRYLASRPGVPDRERVESTTRLLAGDDVQYEIERKSNALVRELGLKKVKAVAQVLSDVAVYKRYRDSRPRA